MKFIKYEGLTNYSISLIDMEIAQENVLSGSEECVFVLEHEALYSAGKSFEIKDFLLISDIPIYYPKRGGRVTIHSPGQLVLYPIINLKNRDINVRSYVEILEKWIIDVLKKFDIEAYLSEDGIGVWTKGSKIGFVGIRIEKGVSSHGLCLNVSNDLDLFNAIIPCGINNAHITSMEKVLNKKIKVNDVAKKFIEMSPFLNFF